MAQSRQVAFGGSSWCRSSSGFGNADTEYGPARTTAALSSEPLAGSAFTATGTDYSPVSVCWHRRLMPGPCTEPGLSAIAARISSLRHLLPMCSALPSQVLDERPTPIPALRVDTPSQDEKSQLPGFSIEVSSSVPSACTVQLTSSGGGVHPGAGPQAINLVPHLRQPCTRLR